MADEIPPPVSLPGLADAGTPEIRPAGDDVGGAKSNRGGAREGAGRKPKAVKLTEALHRFGAAPKAASAAAPAAPAGPVLPPPVPFDSEATRRVLSVLIEAADKWDCDRFFARVVEITKDKSLAGEFRAVREVSTAVKGMALDDAVSLCRVNNWNLGPGWGLAIACAAALAQKAESESKLNELAANKPLP